MANLTLSNRLLERAGRRATKAGLILGGGVAYVGRAWCGMGVVIRVEPIRLGRRRDLGRRGRGVSEAGEGGQVKAGSSEAAQVELG